MYSISSLSHLAGQGANSMPDITILAAVVVFYIALVYEAVRSRNPKHVVLSVLSTVGIVLWFFLR